jgi:glycosyltransferase involved in cell wall biosynthesis
VLVHRVAVSAEDREAVVREIRETQLDAVLHWATGPETFSFTTLEAISAGAAVICSATSGNVAAIVEREHAGWILPDEDTLISFLKNDFVDALLTIDRRQGNLRYNNFSFDHLDC